MTLQNLEIQEESGTFFTPAVSFNAQTGVCSVKGESYLEDTFSFYNHLRNWVVEYFDAGKTSLELSFKMHYFNTSSSRAILDLLKKLKEYEEQGKKITVKWFYPEPDDIEMHMEGEDFESDSRLTFEFIAYPVDTEE